MTRKHENPWRLTAAQCEAMDAVALYESTAMAAVELGISVDALNQRIYVAGKKMGCIEGDRIRKHILWDRFRTSRLAPRLADAP